MQHNRRWTATLAKRPVVSPSIVMLTPVMLASVAVLTSGCSLGDTTLTTIGQPAAQSTDARAQGLQSAIRDDGHAEDHFAATPHQQAYLQALADAGVRPADELMALSIGAYVCQARAAKQSEQAVWDFVLPLVRDDVDDVDDAHATSVAPEVGEVNSATADYIRIATERLC
ncbi:DUF732 domain-containing protein [Mycobacterium sp. Root265]|uniref:DUF732 domain-containing protein n=1 Tax=Mycobacterium sp. Root265 TaxID=1736504 RepID=UPI002E0FCA8E